MTALPPESLAANIAASLRTADEVLAHLETSLRRGGFAEGLTAYRKLCDTLINQRLWSATEAPSAELDVLFAAIGARARAVYGLLSPYTELMRRLAAIDAALEVAQPQAAPPPSQDPIIDALASGETSFTALRSRIQTARVELQARLDLLEKEGRVISRMASGRRLYRLS